MSKQKRPSGAYNLAALSLKSGPFKQRIVKSKVKYNRKRSNKGWDNLSHP